MTDPKTETPEETIARLTREVEEHRNHHRYHHELADEISDLTDITQPVSADLRDLIRSQSIAMLAAESEGSVLASSLSVVSKVFGSAIGRALDRRRAEREASGKGDAINLSSLFSDPMVQAIIGMAIQKVAAAQEPKPDPSAQPAEAPAPAPEAPTKKRPRSK